jgi:hypothetical protein
MILPPPAFSYLAVILLGKDGKSGYDEDDAAPLMGPWMASNEENGENAAASISSSHRPSLSTNIPTNFPTDAMYHVSGVYLYPSLSIFTKVFGYTHRMHQILRICHNIPIQRHGWCQVLIHLMALQMKY